MKTIFAITLALSLGAMAATAADGENKPKPSVPPGAPPAGAPRLPEAYKKYDKNGDGRLDEAERKALQEERRNEMMKKYDKNGDGKLDETERQAMMEERKEMLKKRQADGGPKPANPKPPGTK